MCFPACGSVTKLAEAFLGPVHTSDFCRVEFNSISCGRNATVDSYVALVSHLI